MSSPHSIRFLLISLSLIILSAFRIHAQEAQSVIEDGMFVDQYLRLWEWGDGSKGGVVGATTTNENGKIENSLKIVYEPYKEGMGQMFVSYCRPIPMAGITRKIIIDLKGNGRKHTLIVLLQDAKQQTFGFEVASTENADWKEYTVTIPEEQDGKKIVFPINLYGFQVHKWADQAYIGKTFFQVKNIRAICDSSAGESPVSLLTYFDDPLAIYHLDKPVRIFPRIYSFSPVPRDYEMNIVMYDFKGSQVYKKAVPLTRIQGMKTIGLKLPISKLGPYLGKIEIVSKKKILASRDFSFIVTSKNPNYRKEDPTSPFGICVSAWEPFIERSARLGAKHIRVYGFAPATLYPAKGVFEYEAGGTQRNFDDMVNDTYAAGMKIYPSFTGVPDWLIPPELKGKTPPYPPSDYEAYSGLFKNFMERYKGKIGYVEAYNEPNLLVPENFGTLRGQIDTYDKIVGALSRGAKAGDPSVNVAYISMAGFVPKYYAKLKRLGLTNGWSTINGHYYCFDREIRNTSPEKNSEVIDMYSGNVHEPGRYLFLDRLRDMDRVRRHHLPNKEVMLSEIGWDDIAGPYAVGKYLQACYLMRAFIWSSAEGIDKTLWFFFADDMRPANKYNHYFDSMGLYNNRFEPQPSAAAFNMATIWLGGASHIGDVRNLLSENPNVYAHVFKDKSGAPLLAIFGDLFRSRSKMYVDLPAYAEVYDMWGNRMEIKGKELPLSDETVFVKGLKWDDSIIAQCFYKEDALRDWPTYAGNYETFSVWIDGRNSKITLEGKINITIPEGFKVTPSPLENFSCPPGSRIEKKFQLLIPATASGNTNPWEILITDNRNVRKLFKKNLKLSDAFTMVATPVTEDLKTGAKYKVKVDFFGEQPMNLKASIKAPPQFQIEPSSRETGLMNQDDEKELSFTIKQVTEVKDLSILTNIRLKLENGENGLMVQKGISFGSLPLPKLEKPIQFDGILADWPDVNRLPDQFINSFKEGKAHIWWGWQDEGISLAFKVMDTDIRSFPNAFWEGDVIELWMDTTGKPNEKFVKGTHQFYVTLPSTAAGGLNQVQVGQWHREGDDITKSINDVASIKRGFKQVEDGYILELFIPGSALHGFKPNEGATLKLNMNITFNEGKEASWITSKNIGVDFSAPKNWGSVTLTKNR